MPAVDVLDDTFVRAAPDQVRAATRVRWEGWLPDLSLLVDEDRGVKGVRWVAGTGARTPAGMTGTAEVWLEAVRPGTVVHLYVRLDPSGGPAAGRLARRLPDRVRRTWKRGLNRSKDIMEGEWQG